MKRPKYKAKVTRKTTYQIDQSGKIEHTNKSTIVALANGNITTVKISAIEKQKLIKAMAEFRKPNKTYAYDIFSALIYILLKRHLITRVEIDKEYPGHEAGIKERLIQLLKKNGDKIPEISFGLVGKKCNAHIVGLLVFQEKSKPTIVIKAKEIMEVIFGTQKGWRSRSRRENP